MQLLIFPRVDERLNDAVAFLIFYFKSFISHLGRYSKGDMETRMIGLESTLATSVSALLKEWEIDVVFSMFIGCSTEYPYGANQFPANAEMLKEGWLCARCLLYIFKQRKKET